MKFLINNATRKIYERGTIEKGFFDVDPNRELFKITNENGVFYAVTDGFSIMESDNIPDYYKECIYTKSGEFLRLQPRVTKEERLEAQIMYTAIMTDTLITEE